MEKSYFILFSFFIFRISYFINVVQVLYKQVVVTTSKRNSQRYLITLMFSFMIPTNELRVSRPFSDNISTLLVGPIKVFFKKLFWIVLNKFTGEPPCRSAHSLSLAKKYLNYTRAWIFSGKIAVYAGFLTNPKFHFRLKIAQILSNHEA